MTDPETAREEWENAYDEAMQWRDWQTCEILLNERLTADWYRDQVAFPADES